MRDDSFAARERRAEEARMRRNGTYSQAYHTYATERKVDDYHDELKKFEVNRTTVNRNDIADSWHKSQECRDVETDSLSDNTVYRKVNTYVSTNSSDNGRNIVVKDRRNDPEQARKAKKTIKKIVIIFILLQFIGPIISFLISIGSIIGEFNTELKENGSSLSEVVSQIVNEESGEFSDIMRDFGEALREGDIQDEYVSSYEDEYYEEYYDDRVEAVPIG